jgi:glycosyltransferase involved in cell wall biosynthesis
MMRADGLRIAYLVQQFPPEVGAGPARVTELGAQWRRAGAEVTVITGMPNRPAGVIHPEYRGRLVVEEQCEGLRVLRSWLYASPKHGFARTLLNNTSFMLTGLLNALRRAGPQDVLIASSPPWFPHFSGAAMQFLRGVPLVLEIRDLWPDYLIGMGVVRGRLGQRLLLGAERALLRRAQEVVVVTESFRQRIVEKGVPAERVTVVSNGIDPARYYPASEPPPIQELVRRDGEIVVGYLGNFGASQGLERVLEAAQQLATSPDAPRVRFVLVGEGTAGESVRSLAARMGLDRVALHPPIPKEATRAFYNNCDICLVPLAAVPVLQETVPSKLFEVMACERPVLASLGGEGARIVRESGAGVVVPPGDASEIARGILQLVACSPEERLTMGRQGGEYVRAHYTRQLLAERYLSVLLRAAGRPGGGGP